ncbi:MAG: hypothetical protein ABIS01_06475, partial [Ferruginibacter sp.]
ITDKKSAEIIDKLFSIAKKNGQDLKYKRTEWEDFSVGNIYSFEISCIEKVVRNCKQAFTNELNRQLILKPKYIFCRGAEEQNYSVLPGYNIIFDNAKDLAKLDESVKNNLADICENLLLKNDKTGFYTRDKAELKYYDADTNSKSLYGMSRED